MAVVETIKDRLLKNIIKTNSCWLWRGVIGNHGYGQLCFKYKKYLAHRVSYETFIGPIPKGLFVCHKCDIRECCNPEHLFIGTPQDNANDMLAKGRFPTGNKHWNTKLPVEELPNIKILASFGMHHTVIAKLYKVSRPLISCILAGTRRA